VNARLVNARKALRGAIELRRHAKIPKTTPICIYDVIENLGIDVRFVGEKSFGGMYSKSTNTILVPALRPIGRQAFTCAHELGHWYFGHGTRLDDLKTMEAKCDCDPEEQIANLFAGYFLAPSWTVEKTFSDRNWTPERCSAIEIYTVAVQLGMGYTSLIQHLRSPLELISTKCANELSKITPKEIRSQILNNSSIEYLVIVDKSWKGIPIDLRVGDAVLLPADATIEGNTITITNKHNRGLIANAHCPGISRVATPDSWASFIRVSKKGFVGRSIYRHLEDPDVD